MSNLQQLVSDRIAKDCGAFATLVRADLTEEQKAKAQAAFRERVNKDISSIVTKKTAPQKMMQDLAKQLNIRVPTKKREMVGIPKPRSGYVIFCAEKRADGSLKGDNGDQPNPTDALKKLGTMWQAITEDEKKLYNERAAKEKVEYAEKLAADPVEQARLAKLAEEKKRKRALDAEKAPRKAAKRARKSALAVEDDVSSSDDDSSDSEDEA